MGMQGSGLSDKNLRLRFLTYIFLGVAVFGVILYWKSKLFLTTEYVDFNSAATKKTQQDNGAMKSENFQLDPEEVSPSVN